MQHWHLPAQPSTTKYFFSISYTGLKSRIDHLKRGQLQSQKILVQRELRGPFGLKVNTLGFWQRSSPPPAALLKDHPGSELCVASVYHTVAFPWCTDPSSAWPKQETSQDPWGGFLNRFNSLHPHILDISPFNLPLLRWRLLPGLLQHAESAGEELLAEPVTGDTARTLQ